MQVLRRLRELPALLRAISTSWAAIDAWGREDWEGVVVLLEPLIRAERAVPTDLLMLGIARANQGNFEQALFYLEQIFHDELDRFSEPFYATVYAHLLDRLGRLPEAREVLRRSPRRRWSEQQTRWADEFLEAETSQGPPEIEGFPRRRLFH